MNLTRRDHLQDHLNRHGHGALAQLIAVIGCPPGNEHLSVVIENLHDALAAIGRAWPDAEVAQLQDQTLTLERYLRKDRHLSDDTSPAQKGRSPKAGAAYRALQLEHGENWARQAIIAATVWDVILAARSNKTAKTEAYYLPFLLSSTHTPELPYPSDPLAAKLKLLAEHFRETNPKLATALSELVEDARRQTPDLQTTPHPENRAALFSPPAPKRSLSAKDRLRHLVRNVGVQATVARRYAHRPPEQFIPSDTAVTTALKWVKSRSEAEQIALQTIILLGPLARQAIFKSDWKAIRLDGRESSLCLRVDLPPQTQFRQCSGDGFETAERTYSLPIPRRLAEAISDHLTVPHKANLLRLELERAMRDAFKTAPVIPRFSSLAHLLEIELGGGSSDKALMCLMGTSLHSGIDAAIHYFSPNATALIEHYKQAVSQVAERFGLQHLLALGWTSPAVPQPDYVGYSHRLSVKAFRPLIHHIQKLSARERGRVNEHRAVEQFNARVSWVTLLFLASTGARPNGTVLPAPSEISFHDATAMLSEKDSLGYRSTRLTPILPLVIGEMKKLYAEWRLLRRTHKHINAPETPALITADGYAPPTPTSISQTLGGTSVSWIWPADALRHHFRSRLWELGYSSSILSRLMGHHPRHGAADMPYGSQCIWDLISMDSDSLQAKRMELLKELGFELEY